MSECIERLVVQAWFYVGVTRLDKRGFAPSSRARDFHCFANNFFFHKLGHWHSGSSKPGTVRRPQSVTDSQENSRSLFVISGELFVYCMLRCCPLLSRKRIRRADNVNLRYDGYINCWLRYFSIPTRFSSRFQHWTAVVIPFLESRQYISQISLRGQRILQGTHGSIKFTTLTVLIACWKLVTRPSIRINMLSKSSVSMQGVTFKCNLDLLLLLQSIRSKWANVEPNITSLDPSDCLTTMRSAISGWSLLFYWAYSSQMFSGMPQRDCCVNRLHSFKSLMPFAVWGPNLADDRLHSHPANLNDCRTE